MPTNRRTAAVRRNLGTAVAAASSHIAVQTLLAFALIVPLAATIGEFSNSGFFRRQVDLEILFWPGGKWHWAIPMNVAAIMAVLGLSYLSGIAWLVHRRTLGRVIFAGVGALIAANVVGSAVNYLTGWREGQVVGSMELAGKLDRLILSQWHNPIWEELVFRGIPLLCLAFVVKKWSVARKVATWCYFLIPSLVFAAYHVPGHGYSRLADTFVLSLAFAWLALAYGFSAVMVLHYIFDAMIVLSLGKFRNFRTDEVRWLADHFGLWNSMFSLAVLAMLCAMAFLILRHLWRARGVGESTTEARLTPAQHSSPPEATAPPTLCHRSGEARAATET
ncbi:MAG TPA: CPBP family intramembrane glutamic endopeptidase [Bryobacteraceae bacterium]